MMAIRHIGPCLGLVVAILVVAALQTCQAFMMIAPSSLQVVAQAKNAFSNPHRRHGLQTIHASLDTNSESSTSVGDDKEEEGKPQSSATFSSRPSHDHYDAVVCGGGPAGLLTAIMLTQKYGPAYKIAVCEQRATIPPSPSDQTVWSDVARFYLLGIGHRGQSALRRFGVYEDFHKASVQVDGRRDWQPGMTKVEDGRTTIANKDPPSRVLARDKLVGVLHEHLVQNYIVEKSNNNIDLLYGYQIEPLDFGSKPSDKVTLRITKCEDVDNNNNKNDYQASQDTEQLCDADNVVVVTTDFLIGADGAARTVAGAMEAADKELHSKQRNPLAKLFGKRPFRITKYQDDNPRVYKSVPILLPPDWPRGLNYSARSRDSRITLEALPSDDKGNLCALLLMKPDDELAQANVDPMIVRKFFEEEFPQFSALIHNEEMARIAQKPASRLPVFRYAGPRLHLGYRTLVLGDAAHTVKPYYGLGANTALEDVQMLSDILDNASTSSSSSSSDRIVPKAVPAFSNKRAGDAEALVTISRNMDRPRKWFLINFLLPLILDGMFHKIAPKIFGPNMFGMFQKKGIGFKQIQRKKRLDRALQLTIIGSLLTGVGWTVTALVRLLSQVVGVRQRSIYLLLAVTGVLVSQLKRAATKS